MAENTDNKSKLRYSDAELQEFKELILKKLEQAKANLKMLENDAFGKDSNGDNDTTPLLKTLDDDRTSEFISKEENARQAQRQRNYIKDLEAALVRIENKTYGISRLTGKLIPKERLRAVPHATLSVEDKMSRNKK